MQINDRWKQKETKGKKDNEGEGTYIKIQRCLKSDHGIFLFGLLVFDKDEHKKPNTEIKLSFQFDSEFGSAFGMALDQPKCKLIFW